MLVGQPLGLQGALDPRRFPAIDLPRMPCESAQGKVKVKGELGFVNNNKLALSTLGERIKLARQARGLTLRDLALLTGVDAGYISALENGKRQPGEGRSLALMNLTAELKLDAGRPPPVMGKRRIGETTGRGIPPSLLYPKGLALKKLTADQRAMVASLAWALMDICDSSPAAFKGLAAEIIRIAPNIDKTEQRKQLGRLLVLKGGKGNIDDALDHDA